MKSGIPMPRTRLRPRENLTMPTNDLFGPLSGLYALIFLVIAYLLVRI
jgi:hypothetical protein